MKDMLAKIVEMDKKAQEVMDEAQQDKIKSINEISTKKSQIKKDFFAKARKRIEANRMIETQKAEKEEKKITENKEAKLNAMNALYRTKCGEWVDTIVKLTIEG